MARADRSRLHDRDDRLHAPFGCSPVDLAHDLVHDASPGVGQLVRIRECALDAGHDLLEALRSVERARRGELLVVLADDVLRRPGLAGRGAFVVEDAHRRAVVDERVEQDRPRVRDDRIAVLKQDRQLLEIRVARLLQVDAFAIDGGAKALAPLLVARVWPEEELEALAGADASHHSISRSTNSPS